MTTNERWMSGGCPGGAYSINETWHEQLLPNGVQRPREKHEEEVSSEAILKRNPRKKSSVSSISGIVFVANYSRSCLDSHRKFARTFPSGRYGNTKREAKDAIRILKKSSKGQEEARGNAARRFTKGLPGPRS